MVTDRLHSEIKRCECKPWNPLLIMFETDPKQVKKTWASWIQNQDQIQIFKNGEICFLS